jgi:hypothetical protein
VAHDKSKVSAYYARVTEFVYNSGLIIGLDSFIDMIELEHATFVALTQVNAFVVSHGHSPAAAGAGVLVLESVIVYNPLKDRLGVFVRGKQPAA